MSTKDIKLVEASEKNLKGISFIIPKGKITSVSGASGSGKSTLVHDLIAREISRRSKISLEKASKYENLVRPDFKCAELPEEVVTLPQKSLKQAISSTVVTVTGLNDLLRNEFLKNGVIECECGHRVDNIVSLETIIRLVGKLSKEIRYCYKIKSQKDIKDFSDYAKKNNHKNFHIDGKKRKFKSENIESSVKINDLAYVVIDNFESLKDGQHLMSHVKIFSGDKCIYDFSIQTFCSHCLSEYQVKSISLFTKSTISDLSGFCRDCNGIGSRSIADYNKIINKKSPLSENFLNIPHNGKAYKYIHLQDSHINRVFKKHNIIRNSKKFSSLNKVVIAELKELIEGKVMAHKDHPVISEFLKVTPCKSCNGSGFNRFSEAVKLKGHSVSDILSLSAGELSSYLDSDSSAQIAHAIESLSIGHLSLNRGTDTLSGGELQRLKLVKLISQDLKDSTIIIDEPSLGLSLYDTKKLFSIFEDLKNNGNTVILVDHSDYIIKKSDYNLNLGPGSGSEGGYISEIDNKSKIKRSIRKSSKTLEFLNLSKNNLKNTNVSIPLYSFTSIIGPSGSGKSSLGLEIYSNASSSPKYKGVDSCIYISQKEAAINRRSTVASYLNLSDPIRNIYHHASYQRFSKSYFSSNNKISACQDCQGIGLIETEICPSCNGGKLSPGPLSITFQDKNIAEFLSLPVCELIDLDISDSIQAACLLLIRLGLGYLNLGRPTPEVSGGELQRIKLAKFLLENNDVLEDPNKHGLIILDEPSRGLNKLNIISIINLIDDLLDKGNTVVAIEHNLDVIKGACHIIELGPGSGANGGELIYSGASKNFKLAKRINVNKNQKVIKNSNRIKCEPWLDDEIFNLQKEYSRRFVRIVPAGSSYFATKNSLEDEFRGHETYFFNPFINYLHRYKRIPLSLLKDTLKSIFDAGLTNTYINSKPVPYKAAINSLDESNIWMFSIETNDFEKAYQLGGGCIITNKRGKTIFNGTRIVDSTRKVVGSILVNHRSFNKYYNGCKTCAGKGSVRNYKKLAINDDYKVTDINFYPKNTQIYIKKYLSVIKRAVKKFKDEKVVNLDMPLRLLNGQDLSIALHGLSEIVFIKENGRSNAMSDKIFWPGIISFLEGYEERYQDEISTGKKTNKYVNCPDCSGHGYHREIDYYHVDGEPLTKKLP